VCVVYVHVQVLCVYMHCLCIILPDIVFFIQHQQQVAAAVERAKQVTMSELNAIVRVLYTCINCIQSS